MISTNKYNFDNLKKDVIDLGICGKCGGCVSFCSANSIGALEMGANGLPKYRDKDKCLECGLCYMVCPQIDVLADEMRDKFGWSEPIGQYSDIFSLRSTDLDILKIATDGGFVTSLLIDMLENKNIDGAVVSVKTEALHRKPIIATTKEQLISAAGSQFYHTSHLEKIGEDYSCYMSVIKTLNDPKIKSVKKLAVVGTPGQINTIKKMQVLGVVPSDIVVFTIGLFCMQCFAIDDLMNKDFARKHQINIDDITKVNIKDQFILQMKSGITINIPLEEIETIAHPACLACGNFANEFADISVGGLASKHGYTTVVVRTVKGKRAIADALYNRSIEHTHEDDNEGYQTNKGNRLTQISEFVDKKEERSQKYLASLAN